jgi:hypothetical protein
MEFKRGRKKNQINRSFILKDMPSQSLVKVLFLIKTRKRKTHRSRIRFQRREDALKKNTLARTENVSGQKTLLRGERRTLELYAST